MRRIKVLVVEDSSLMRRAMTMAIARDPALEVLGTAAHGRMGVEMFQKDKPDVITMDIEMPVMDGLEALREIRKLDPRVPVIMFSSHTQRGARATVVALTIGATDYVAKPANMATVNDSWECLETELIPKIKLYGERAITRAELLAAVKSEASPAPAGPHRVVRRVRAKLLCIGVSTGGPNALTSIFKGFAGPLTLPVLIVQHMPAAFTKLLAERLSSQCSIVFHEAHDGQPIENGHAYFAPGGRHMELDRHGTQTLIRLHDGPPENSCRPSVDVLFRSAAAHFGNGVLGVVLTGMGRDGLEGCRIVRDRGGFVIAQDEASSVVWGMPGAVVQAGLANETLPLDIIAAEIARLAKGRPVRPPQ